MEKKKYKIKYVGLVPKRLLLNESKRDKSVKYIDTTELLMKMRYGE